MYNLVSCYDTLELKSRGDVLSDKVVTKMFCKYVFTDCDLIDNQIQLIVGLHERHRRGRRGDAADLPERVYPDRHDPRDQPHLRQVPVVLQVQR